MKSEAPWKDGPPPPRTVPQPNPEYLSKRLVRVDGQWKRLAYPMIDGRCAVLDVRTRRIEDASVFKLEEVDRIGAGVDRLGCRAKRAPKVSGTRGGDRGGG